MIEAAHRRAAEVTGEMSLACIRRKASPAIIRRWGAVLKSCGEDLIRYADTLQPKKEPADV